MRRTKAVLILAGAVSTLLAGCETTYKQVPTITAAEGASSVRFAHGNALIMSEGRLGIVWLKPVRYFRGSKVFFEVVAFNKTNQPVNFGTEDIQLRSGPDGAISVYDFDSLQHEARRQAQAELMAASLQEGMDLWHADRVARRDPYAANRIWRDSQNRYFATDSAVNASLEDAIYAYDRVTLQTTTIDPYTSFGGVVFSPNVEVAQGASRELVANVRFAGEDHLFRLRIVPEGVSSPIQTGLPAVRREQVEAAAKAPETWLWNQPR